jgi:hypothetical protein
MKPQLYILYTLYEFAKENNSGSNYAPDFPEKKLLKYFEAQIDWVEGFKPNELIIRHWRKTWPTYVDPKKFCCNAKLTGISWSRVSLRLVDNTELDEGEWIR